MKESRDRAHSLHWVGVFCGLGAGVWLGGAEAPTKLVTVGLSPYAVSLCMVMGVFVARWTLPTLMKGTSYVFADLLQRRHLLVWAVLAGGLWAVANTLTVFAIRDVGLSIAFPLWNANSLIGMFWGWLLFNEMRGAGAGALTKVIGGAVAIVTGAVILSLVTVHGHSTGSGHAMQGIAAALGASLLWGTMYVPYRKAYLSGMNPLSFVTVFTGGELVTMAVLAVTLKGGTAPLIAELHLGRPVLFWIFLGGFCWVIGDIFQQYATKYIGIGRGIPLANTNQLWGLAWGALVFGEFASLGKDHLLVVLAASLLMIVGAGMISLSTAPARERQSGYFAIDRECRRYGMSLQECIAAQSGSEAQQGGRRPWWDGLIVLGAIGVFVYLARGTARPPLMMHMPDMVALCTVMLVAAGACGWILWKRTRFS